MSASSVRNWRGINRDGEGEAEGAGAVGEVDVVAERRRPGEVSPYWYGGALGVAAGAGVGPAGEAVLTPRLKSARADGRVGVVDRGVRADAELVAQLALRPRPWLRRR